MDGTVAPIGTRIWTRIFLVAMTVTLFLGEPFLGSPAWGQSANRKMFIADVIVSGNRTVPTPLILANVKTKPDREYKRHIVEEDIRNLAKLGSFSNVEVRGHNTNDGRIVVEFIVEEHPNRITKVEIRNARHLRQEDIGSLKRLRRGAPLNPTLVRQAVQEIQDYYRSKGRIFATVKVEEGTKPTDSQVIFNVTEGPVVRIRSIRFTGNDSLATSARLRTQVQSKQMLLRLIGGDYNPAMVDFDVQKLVEYYRNNGYLDVRISREVLFSPDYSRVDLVFHIQEGRRYKVGDVEVAGVKNLSQSQVESFMTLTKGKVYNENDATQDIKNITDAHGWRGYKVQVRKELFFPAQNPGVVNVNYQILDQERPPAKVGQIIIVGNEVTKSRVILRALGIFPGQTLRYPELRRAEQMLTRLNLFETNPELGTRPTVTVLEDPNNPNSEFKDVLVQVKETYTGSLMFGLGVNSDAGLVGTIVLNERNFDLFRPPTSLADVFEGRAFRGGGQELRIEAVPGTELQRYTISFREPFLFDRPYSLTTAAYYYDRIFLEYTERRVGGRVTIGHQLNEFWSVSGGVRVEGINVDDVSIFAPDDYQSVRGQNFLAAPRTTVVRDSRDSFLRPTEGSRAEASFEQAFGDFTFPVVNVEGSKYFTVFQRRDGSGKHVIAARSQFSWAGDDTPVFERFFAGGFRSLRGFSFRGVGPREGGFNVGGNMMLLASLEYQVPVRANDKFYLVGFLDSGTVEDGFEITNYRLSAGIGARIVVPMMGPVPIALDFGFPIVRGPQDEEQIFSFYVGINR